jgi:excisionase family DNA binding protein
MKKKATDHSEEDGESQQPPPPLFLSLDEAAALMGLWPSFIEEIAKAGKIKSLTYNGTMKVSRSSLEKYFEDLENKINESAIQRDIKALEKID